MEQPFFAEQADIEINTVERPERSDGVGCVLENVRRPYGIRRLEELRKGTFRNVIIELFVVQAPARQKLLSPTLCKLQARAQSVHGIHRTRIIDVVSRDQR